MEIKILQADTLEEMEKKLNLPENNTYQLVGNMEYMNGKYVQMIQEVEINGWIDNNDVALL